MALVAYITTLGAQLIMDSASTGLEFTRAELGTGGTQDATAARAKTSLGDSYAADAGIGNVELKNGAAKVTVQYSNANQSGTLEVNEIAVYAKQQGDTAGTTEVLICYANFGGDTDDILPSQAATFARLYEIIMTVTGVQSVTFTVNSGTYQAAINAVGILKRTSEGDVVAAVAGTDYAAANHTHALDSASITGILPISKGGTNANTAAQALANLGIIYSATEPTYQAGAIWLQPVS